MPELVKQSDEQFCRLLAQGMKPLEAYCYVKNSAPSESARTSSVRLKNRDYIQARLLELGKQPCKTLPKKLVTKGTEEVHEEVHLAIEKAAKKIKTIATDCIEEIGAFLTASERREYLARIVRTPIGLVNEQSDLCQYAEFTEQGRKIKMPDKLTALKLDAQLCGDLNANETTVNINGGHQAIVVNLPSVVATPRIPPRTIEAEIVDKKGVK